MTEIRGKKFLVTGGAGFVGSHTVDSLIERGAKVSIIDNLSTGSKENINPKAKFYNLNINSPKIAHIFKKEKPDYIYHFAFEVRVPKTIKNPELIMDSIEGSLSILTNAVHYKIKKIIFASTAFIYGNPKKLPAKESDIPNFISPYACAKYSVENFLEYFYNLYKTPYIILRYATIYGPRQYLGAIPDYIRKLAAGSQADMWGDGNKTRDYVFIEDVVRANMAALSLSNSYTDPVFNIGTGTETTLNSVYQKIAEFLQKQAKPVYHPERAGELNRYYLDPEKARRVLGWKADTKLDEGLAKTIKALS